MFITNPEILNKTYICNEKIANHLIKNGFMIIGIKDDLYYFNNTSELESAVKRIPFWVKFL